MFDVTLGVTHCYAIIVLDNNSKYWHDSLYFFNLISDQKN
ncbi:hypothetical protein PROPEN_02850 [Proteus penneri ATCC 35198]|nr:hypothetical protein PROPEN_02850 [Proteus penneri ATCC 35198]